MFEVTMYIWHGWWRVPHHRSYDQLRLVWGQTAKFTLLKLHGVQDVNLPCTRLLSVIISADLTSLIITDRSVVGGRLTSWCNCTVIHKSVNPPVPPLLKRMSDSNPLAPLSFSLPNKQSKGLWHIQNRIMILQFFGQSRSISTGWVQSKTWIDSVHASIPQLKWRIVWGRNHWIPSEMITLGNFLGGKYLSNIFGIGRAHLQYTLCFLHWDHRTPCYH